MRLNEAHHLVMRGNDGALEILQQRKHSVPSTHAAHCHLSEDEGMAQNLIAGKQRQENLIGSAEVINPDRCINQGHFGLGRRRGAAFASGSLPPSSASRLAASR
jgi:hypothetical protein